MKLQSLSNDLCALSWGAFYLEDLMSKDVGKSNVKMALTLGLVAIAFFVSGIYMMISKAGA